jgi:hypothetical protein
MTPEPLKLAGDQCQVHRYHRPPVRETEVHHIWPLGMGGPDAPGNKVRVCPTGHANIHRALRALRKGERPKGTRQEVALARRGYAEWSAAGGPV